jgi:predicted RNase H-like HicB family nuclease
MYKYEIIIYWSNEDQAFVAEVPELSGCMAHGTTQELALKQVNEAIRLWIDTAKEFGDPVSEPKGRYSSEFRVPGNPTPLHHLTISWNQAPPVFHRPPR